MVPPYDPIRQRTNDLLLLLILGFICIEIFFWGIDVVGRIFAGTEQDYGWQCVKNMTLSNGSIGCTQSIYIKNETQNKTLEYILLGGQGQ